MWLDRKWLVRFLAGVGVVAVGAGAAMLAAPSQPVAVAIGLGILVASVAFAALGTLTLSWRTWNSELSRALEGAQGAPPAQR